MNFRKSLSDGFRKMFSTTSQLELVDVIGVSMVYTCGVCTGDLTQKQTCLWWTRLSWAEHTRTSQVTALFMSLPLGIFQKDALSNRCLTYNSDVNCHKLETLREYAAFLMPELELQCPAGKQCFTPLTNEKVAMPCRQAIFQTTEKWKSQSHRSKIASGSWGELSEIIIWIVKKATQIFVCCCQKLAATFEHV